MTTKCKLFKHKLLLLEEEIDQVGILERKGTVKLNGCGHSEGVKGAE